MNDKDLIALALAGIAVWMIAASRKVAAAPMIVGPMPVPLPQLFHPADVYAGTWTANGPLIPSQYSKQIWD